MVTYLSRYLILSLISLLAFASVAVNATTMLTTKVDRNPVMERESFVLEIVADDSLNTNDLDLSPLNKSGLSVGRTATSSQTQIINGQISKTTTWSVVLVARKAGKYTIPSLQIDGVKSQPIQLEVIKVDPNSKGSSQPIFLKNSIESSELYLQQSVRFVTRLFISPEMELQSGTLSDPELENAYIKQQGKDKNTSEIIMGKRYQVIERVYTVTPQTSGEFTIVSPTFNGDVVANTNRRRSMFSMAQTKPVSAFGDDLAINVRPIPKNYSGAWLASELVRLDQELQPQKDRYEVGEAITRTYTLTALNVNEEQLPEVSGEYPVQFKVYPDQSESHSALRQNALVAQRISSEAIVANQPGTYTLPEVVVPWFNVKTKRQEFARLPEQTVVVTAAEGDVSAMATPAQQASNQSASDCQCESSEGTPTSHSPSPWWVWFGWPLWVLTVGIWILSNVFRTKNRAIATAEVEKPDVFDSAALKKACANNDLTSARAEILRWGRQIFGPSSNLDTIKTRVGSALKQQLDHMDTCQFSTQTSAWHGQSLWNEFQAESRKKQSVKAKRDTLPPLNG